MDTAKQQMSHAPTHAQSFHPAMAECVQLPRIKEVRAYVKKAAAGDQGKVSAIQCLVIKQLSIF